jgi:branched-chain amino acid transport system permease protein
MSAVVSAIPAADLTRPAWALSLLLLAAMLVAPWIVGNYIVYLLSLTCIFSLVTLGLNLLTGLSGQISLGHAGFFAIGAYATGLLTQSIGVPFPIALILGGLISTAIGAVAALPALRLRNLYLAIATLGFGTVVQKTLFEWQSVTGGGKGLELAPAWLGPLELRDAVSLYYVILAVTCLGIWCARNIARGRTGRAMQMLRDSDIAAGTLGIHVAGYKVAAFAISAFYAAIAGGLYAVLVRYINPEGFNTALSINFLSMIVIGGLATVPGSVLGAAFYVALPELFRGIKDAPGLVFGVTLIVVMVFLPDGLWSLLARARGAGGRR